MVIKRSDVLGLNTPKPAVPAAPAKPELSPEGKAALEVLNSIDTGMTLTRFQIEAATRFSQESHGDVTVDDMVRSAMFALTTPKDDDTDADRAQWLGIALEAIVIAIDILDMDSEDVARRNLDEL